MSDVTVPNTQRLTEQFGQAVDGIEQADNPQLRAGAACQPGTEGTGYASGGPAELDPMARSHGHSDAQTPGLDPTR